MVVRELVAKISYQLNKSSVKTADASINKTKSDMNEMGNAGTSALSKIVGVASAVSSRIRSIGSNAQYSSSQLQKMGAFQDKTGRWHGSNGQYIKINADTSSAISGIGNLRGGLGGLVGAAGMVGKAFAATFAVEKIMEFTSEIKKSADEMMNLDGRLRTITKTDGERYAVEDKLYALSQQNRQDMGSMGDLYYKVARGAERNGFTSDDSMRLTDIVSKSLTVGGASTAEAQSTILQLGQALGSGTLQGDELHSLDENASYLMEHIAKNMGVTIGDLKEMGSKGELTSKKVIQAILASGTAIDGEFGKMPVTIGQALTNAGSTWDYFIMRIERGTGVFSFIGTFINNTVQTISANMKEALDWLDEVASFDEWGSNNEEFANSFPILAKLADLWNAIKETIISIGQDFAPILDMFSKVDWTTNIMKGIQLFEDIFVGLGSSIEPFFKAISNFIQTFLPMIGEIAGVFKDAFVYGFTAIVTVFQIIIEVITWVINLVTEFAEAFPLLAELILTVGAAILAWIFAPWLLVIGAIGMVIAILAALWEDVVSLWNGFMEKASSAIEAVKGFFAGLRDYALSVIAEIGNAIQSWIMEKIQWAQEKLDGLKSFANGIIDGLNNSVSNAYSNYNQYNNVTVGTPEAAAVYVGASNLGNYQ